MSDKEQERKLDQAQNQQRKVGDAESNPETTGPAENLRERAAELNETDEDSKEHA